MTFKTRITILMIHDHEHLANVNSHICIRVKMSILTNPVLAKFNNSYIFHIYIFFPLMDISFNIIEKYQKCRKFHNLANIIWYFQQIYSSIHGSNFPSKLKASTAMEIYF